MALLGVEDFRARIRYDPDSKMGSVLDVIALITGTDQKTASTTFKRIVETYPNVSAGCGIHQFSGRGQRATPVAHLSTLLEIAWLCPGKHAMEFRRTGAVTMCRALGGDLSLVEQIKERHSEIAGTEEQAAFLEGTGVSVDKANGQALSRREMAEVLKLEAEAMKMQAEAMKMQAEARAMQLANHENAKKASQSMAEMAASETDVRHRLYLQDASKNIVMQSVSYITGSDQNAIQTANENANLHKPINISDVAADLGFRRLDHSKLGAIGKVMARLYRERYNEEPAKHLQYVLGAGRMICSYVAKDRDLMEQAVLEVMG